MLNRIEREKKTVEKMIGIYCRLKHNSDVLCNDCQIILEYAHNKLDNCPYSIEKPACNVCPIHCYRHEEKVQIREIMRFSGPKMLSRHPYLAVRHLMDKRKEVKELKKIRKTNK